MALVCGYAPRERAERYFGMFVCHGDDSGKGADIFVVGGLTAQVGDWVALTERWQAALDEKPRLEYFKFAEAFGRYGQFNPKRISLTERSNRVRKFIKIINAHCFRGDATITFPPLHKALFQGKFSRTVDQVFTATYTGVMYQCALGLTKQGVQSKVDFIFDEMDETTLLEIRRAHRLGTRHRDAALRTRLGQPPITRDDKQVIALQAADLWAGVNRQRAQDLWDGRRTIAGKWFSAIRLMVHVQPMHGDELVRIGEEAMQRMKALNLTYETGKERSKRLAPARKLLRSEG